MLYKNCTVNYYQKLKKIRLIVSKQVFQYITYLYISQDDTLEETGWKLVHGDVFRPPHHPTLLVACIGSGIQLFSMMIIVLGNIIYANVSVTIDCFNIKASSQNIPF
jgi:hypothetical protein